MSQRRNLSYVVNDLNRNSDVSNRRSRTSIFRDFNESTLSKRFTFMTLSSSSYVKKDIKEEYKKEELINNEDVNV